MRLYKAFVSSVTTSKEGNHKQIYVQEKVNRGTGARPRPATPPSTLPITQIGSGTLSVPDKGAGCIVLEVSPNERHIIRYIPHPNTSQWGLLYPPKLQSGTVMFSSNGFYKATLTLSRKGRVTLKSNLFSQLWIDGSANKIFSRSKSLDLNYSGGYWRHSFNKEDKSTSDIQIWTTYQDVEGLSDQKLRTEQGYNAPVPPMVPPYTYKDKVLRSVGTIKGEKALYTLETRQSRKALTPVDKNIVTKLRLGYQDSGNRFNKPYPGGSIIDWTGKKNIKKDIGTFAFRWGKLRKDTPNSKDKGEIFRIQALEGLNSGIPLGMPLKNPLGEGQGYKYSKGGDAEQTFSLSFGLLEDSTLYRASISHEPLTGPSLKYKRVLGGEKVWSEEISQDKALIDTQLTQESFQITRKVAGGELNTLFNDQKAQITYKGEKGETQVTIEGNKTEILNADGTKVVISDNSIVLNEKGGSKLKIAGGKVGLGSGSNEVLQILEDTLTALENTVSPGYGAPIPTKALFTKAKTDLSAIKGGI